MIVGQEMSAAPGIIGSVSPTLSGEIHVPYKDPEKRREYERERSRARWNGNPEYRERRRVRNRENIRERRANDSDGTLRERERENLRAWQQANPERMAELNRDWRAANPEKVKQGNARKHRKSRHGLDDLKFTQALADQDGRCCYCRRPLTADNIHIDHDHSCTCGPDKSCDACRRGLSCRACNTAIGLLGDDPDRMELVAANLRRLTAEARVRINGKAVQTELFDINEAARRREESALWLLAKA